MCGAAAIILLLHQRREEEQKQKQREDNMESIVHEAMRPKVDEAKKLLGEIDKLSQQAELEVLEATLVQKEKRIVPTPSVQDIQNLRK